MTRKAAKAYEALKAAAEEPSEDGWAEAYTPDAPGVSNAILRRLETLGVVKPVIEANGYPGVWVMVRMDVGTLRSAPILP